MINFFKFQREKDFISDSFFLILLNVRIVKILNWIGKLSAKYLNNPLFFNSERLVFLIKLTQQNVNVFLSDIFIFHQRQDVSYLLTNVFTVSLQVLINLLWVSEDTFIISSLNRNQIFHLLHPYWFLPLLWSFQARCLFLGKVIRCFFWKSKNSDNSTQ